MSSIPKAPKPAAVTGLAAPDAWVDADADARRRMIVDLAMELLRDEGLPAVTMRNVAGRLGVGTMTLYTYVQGQHGLHREMVQRGFEMLHSNCCDAEAEARVAAMGDDPTACWVEGGKRYLRFALANPSLYKLMFDHPMSPDDRDLMIGGFKPLFDDVTEELIDRGWTDLAELPREARRRAGRFWITVHGVAMLAIAGRLCVLEGDLDQLLDDLLPRVAPT